MLTSSTTTSTPDLTHNSLKSITYPIDQYKLLFSNYNKHLMMKRDLSISTTTKSSSSMDQDQNYHGGSSASIPFMWESQPGTPKVKLRENPLPPLTPPPSYCYTTTKKSSSSNVKTRKKTSSSKPNLIRTIFPKHDTSTTKNTTRPRNNNNNNNIFPSSPNNYSLSSPSSSSSLSSSPRSISYYSSSSVPSSPACTKHRGGGRRWRMMSSSPRRLSVDSRVNNCHDHEENYEEYGGHDHDDESSPVSILCFNGRSSGANNVRSRSSCYSSFIKVLLNHK